MKSVEGHSFFIAVNAGVIRFGERKRLEAIRLNLVQTQGRGIGGAGSEKGHGDGAGKFLRREAFDGLVQG